MQKGGGIINYDTLGPRGFWGSGEHGYFQGAGEHWQLFKGSFGEADLF